MKKLVFSPHRRATRLSGENDPQLIFQQVRDELLGGNAQTANAELRGFVHDLTLTNLWFALKVVAGYAGPFDELDEDVDIDSCNFYQTYDVPGAKNAIFMPRGHYKSTIFTTGGTWWDALRDPTSKTALINAKEDNSVDFMKVIKHAVEDNELLWWVMPAFAVDYKALERWNDRELVFPTRPKYAKEPTVGVISLGGASEGNHFRKLKIDDPIGLKALNADRSSGAEMFRSMNWILSSQRTLLHKWETDQVWIIGTRYGPDDAYTLVTTKVARVEGYPAQYDINLEEPIWTVYNREVKENGKIIKPDIVTESGLAELAKDDWWTYVTQYQNQPEKSGLSEFNEFPSGKAELVYEADMGWSLTYQGPGGEHHTFLLAECDVVQACDPAATERYISARTSRSAVVVWALTPLNDYVLVSQRAGYVGSSEMISWLFANKRKFEGVMRATMLEAQGAFKLLGAPIREKEIELGIPLNLRAIPAVGDKDARIRTQFEPILAQHRVFVVEGIGEDFEVEKKGFPQSRTKDVLDASAHAVAALVLPESGEDRDRREAQRNRWRAGRNTVTGY